MNTHTNENKHSSDDECLFYIVLFEKAKHPPFWVSVFFFGDPDGIRTRVTAVKGRCLRPLDHRAKNGGCNWTRTNDTPGMNRML